MLKISVSFISAIALFVASAVSIHAQGWTILNSNTEKHLYDIEFINSLTGFACGEDIILRTTDGGIHWDSVGSGNGQPLKAVMLEGDRGYVAGSFTLLKTSNSGASWRGVGNLPATGYWCDVNVAGEDVFLCGGGSIFKYHGAIDQWVAQYSDYRSIERIAAFNSDTAFACGSEGMMYSTVDGGEQWLMETMPSSVHLKDILFSTREIGFSCGGGDILKTENGGRSWQLIYSLPSVQFNSLSQCGEVLRAFGNDGIIRASSDEGASWEVSVSGTANALHRSCIVNSRVFVAGDNGTILCSDDLTSIENNASLPKGYWLGQNYPNPFNPTTKIDFSLPEYGKVKISVYDVSGKEVKVLIDDNQSAGNHSIEFSGNKLSSGIYFYRIEIDDFAEVKKMILLK